MVPVAPVPVVPVPVAPVPVSPVVPVPLVVPPVVPLVPDVVPGAVADVSLGAVLVGSFFLQAPSTPRLAIKAAVTRNFGAMVSAFICSNSSFTSNLCRRSRVRRRKQ